MHYSFLFRCLAGIRQWNRCPWLSAAVWIPVCPMASFHTGKVLHLHYTLKPQAACDDTEGVVLA